MSVTIDHIVLAQVAAVGVKLLSTSEAVRAFVTSQSEPIDTDEGIVTLLRSRTTVDTSDQEGTTTVVKRELPTTIGEVEDLGIVFSNAAEETPGLANVEASFAFTINAGIRQHLFPTAVEYVARLSAPRLVPEHADPFVAVTRLAYWDADGVTRWAISVEPRFGIETSPLVFLSVTYFTEVVGGPLPDGDAMRQIFRRVWHELHDCVARMNTEGDGE